MYNLNTMCNAYQYRNFIESIRDRAISKRLQHLFPDQKPPRGQSKW